VPLAGRFDLIYSCDLCDRDARVDAMYLVIRKFDRMHNVRDAAQRAETGLVALLKKSPGFVGYCIFDAGGHVGGSVTFFADRHSAEQANERAMAWINASLPDLFDGEPEITFGDVLYCSGGFTAQTPAGEDMPR
jgi:hypothetical protein